MIRIRMSTELVSDLMFINHMQTMTMTGLDEEYPIVDVSMDPTGIITFMLDDGKAEIVDQLLEYRHPMYSSSNKDTIAGWTEK